MTPEQEKRIMDRLEQIDAYVWWLWVIVVLWLLSRLLLWGVSKIS